MGLFGKKKEQPLVAMPKPTAPFVPSQPSQGASLKDQLAMNQAKPVPPQAPAAPAKPPAPAGLPPLPDDISKDVGDVAKRVSAMSDKVSKLEDELPPLPDANTAEQPQPTTPVQPTEQPQQPAPSQPGAKVFVRLDKYSEILSTINKMESKINELQNALGQITSIKDSEQQIIGAWNNLINEARDRVAEVNSKLPPLNR